MGESERTTWERVTAAFEAALALDVPGREAYLSALERDDPAVHREVLSLLEADARPFPAVDRDRVAIPVGPEADLAPGARQASGFSGDPAAPDPRIGERVGPYEIDGFLAAGGMGAVYTAHRATGDFEQDVAIKVVHRGIAGDEAMRRFDAERQIVARLDHPNIARLLDGGTTNDGLPWFAMELVRGAPITEYARRSRLGLDDRLRLLVDVAAAVDFAHRSLVVHRDLKPGNILVSEEGTPKLLDFGIAKVLEEGPEAQDLTRTGAAVLTPAYASPEQVEGGPITTATDTFALGLLLYELVTGRHAYPRALSDPELREHIRTRTPPPPSQAVMDDDAAEHAPWARRLRGDLDLICLKALRKEPERRYPTAAALAQDLSRFLEGRPVSARPDSLRYRAGRWLRRNRAAAGVAALAAVALVGSSVVYTTNLRAERDRARTEEQRATAALSFLTDLFRESSPSLERRDTLPVGSFLDRGVEQLRSGAVEEPEVAASLLGVLGDVVYGLGRVQQADSLVAEAMALRRQTLSGRAAGTDLDLARLERLLGRIRNMNGDLDSSVALLEQAAARYEAAQGPFAVEVGMTLRALAEATEKAGDVDSALVIARRAAEIHAVNPGPETQVYATSVGILARMLDLRGQYNEARDRYAQSRNALAAAVGETDPAFLDATFNLADMERRAGNLEAAERVLRELVEVETRIYGEKHHLVATDLNTLGSLLTELGRYDEAETLIRRAMQIRIEIFGPEHYQVATSHNTLGRVADARGNLDEAERQYRQAYEISRIDLGEDHRNRAMNLLNLAGIARRRGQWDDALAKLDSAAAMIDRLQDGETQDWGHVQFALALTYDLMGRDADALAIYERLLPFRRRTLAPGSELLLRTVHGYGMALSGVGRHEEALERLEEARAGLGTLSPAQPDRLLRVNADLALARARRAVATGTPLPAGELPRLREALAAWVDRARVRDGERDAVTNQARARLAELDSLTRG